MGEHAELNDSAPLTWSSARSAKDRTAVGRSVAALLDALAPEQTLTRAERERERIERHRTPTGCVLQGPEAALSVSWFADGMAETGFGELHINVWRGVVARRGTQAHKGGATVVASMVLRPDEAKLSDGIWLDASDALWDTPRLAEHCEALLEKQLTS